MQPTVGRASGGVSRAVGLAAEAANAVVQGTFPASYHLQLVPYDEWVGILGELVLM